MSHIRVSYSFIAASNCFLWASTSLAKFQKKKFSEVSAVVYFLLIKSLYCDFLRAGVPLLGRHVLFLFLYVPYLGLCVCVCVCARACVRACMCVCMRVCIRRRGRGEGGGPQSLFVVLQFRPPGPVFGPQRHVFGPQGSFVGLQRPVLGHPQPIVGLWCPV